MNALLKNIGHDCAAFITAWNPMSQPLSLEENRNRQQSLLDEVSDRGLTALQGIVACNS